MVYGRHHRRNLAAGAFAFVALLLLLVVVTDDVITGGDAVLPPPPPLVVFTPFSTGGVEGDLPLLLPVLVISPLRYFEYIVSIAPDGFDKRVRG